MAQPEALDNGWYREARALVRLVLDSHFPGPGGQTRMEKETGIKQGVISVAARTGEKVGVQMLRALARFRPVEVLKLMGISPETLIALWTESAEGASELANVEGLPDSLRRAARAAIELYGCTADEARRAAVAARAGEEDLNDESPPEFWTLRLRGYLPPRKKSGVRRK